MLQTWVKSCLVNRKKIDGIAAFIMLVFYLQTCSIILPRSISLGVRGGLQQAFGLSLKKSVTYSSRRCVQSNRQTLRLLHLLAITHSCTFNPKKFVNSTSDIIIAQSLMLQFE